MSELEGLELHLRYVGSLCERAIAYGWHTGRITKDTGGDRYPFQSEVAALTGSAQAQAQTQLLTATEKVRSLEKLIASAREQARTRPEAGTSPSPRPESGRQHWEQLDELARRFGLSPLAVEILFIIAAPQLWGELARLYGIAANDPARPLCDELLVCQFLDIPLGERWQIASELSPDGPLLRHGLVMAHGSVRPFVALTTDPIISSWLQGDRSERIVPDGHIQLLPAERSAEELVLPAGLLTKLTGALAIHPKDTPLRLVLRGRLGSGRRALLAALAQRRGLKLGLISMSLLWQDRLHFEERLRALLRQVVLRDWLPCIDGDGLGMASDGEMLTCLREVLKRHPGPLFVRCGLDAPPLLEPGYLQFEMPQLSEAQRAAVFQGALREFALPLASAEPLAAKYRVGPGVIRRVVAQVARGQVGDGSDLPGERALQARLESALRQHRSTQLGSLATAVTRLVTWQQVVLPQDLVDSIQEFINRIRSRRQVYDLWGMDSVMTSSRGFTALFQGSAGTGKSMVAGLIARELGYDLYRIDVSRILSRWIGETEQNLARLFDAAEDGQAVILFDEADALFTKRTEVRSSVDRYANVQVNYLLQRLDAFEGIAILTTNQGTAIDAAFKRRLSMRLTFPFPDEEIRHDLWRVHLPDTLPVEEPLDLKHLADSYELSGGYIRNAVLRAAFLAAQDGLAVSQAHLEQAIRLEYREAGKLFEGGVLE